MIYAIPVSETKPGDMFVADEGFTCLFDGEIVKVEADDGGDLFVTCAGPEDEAADYTGPHGLDGQLDEYNGVEVYVGFRRARWYERRWPTLFNFFRRPRYWPGIWRSSSEQIRIQRCIDAKGLSGDW